MLNNTSSVPQTTCIDNVEDSDKTTAPIHNNKVSPITAKSEAIAALPLPPSTYASPSSTLIRNSSFYYDSDSNEAVELSFNCLYIGDDHHRYSDNDAQSDCDSVPLIERITPPPPLLFVCNKSTVQPADDINDTDDETESIHHLSVIIPSPLTLSNSSPVQEQNESCDLFEANHVIITPMAYDIDVHDDEPRRVCTPCCDKLRGTNDANEKRFDWSAAKDHDVNVMNEYLMQHIRSLMDDNLSD